MLSEKYTRACWLSIAVDATIIWPRAAQLELADFLDGGDDYARQLGTALREDREPIRVRTSKVVPS